MEQTQTIGGVPPSEHHKNHRGIKGSTGMTLVRNIKSTKYMNEKNPSKTKLINLTQLNEEIKNIEATIHVANHT